MFENSKMGQVNSNSGPVNFQHVLYGGYRLPPEIEPHNLSRRNPLLPTGIIYGCPLCNHYLNPGSVCCHTDANRRSLVNIHPYPFHTSRLSPSVIHTSVRSANKCFMVMIAHGHAAFIDTGVSTIPPNRKTITGPITILDEHVPAGQIHLCDNTWYLGAVSYTTRNTDPVRKGSLRDHYQRFASDVLKNQDYQRVRHQFILNVERELLGHGPRHDTAYGRYYFDTAIHSLDLSLLSEHGNNHIKINEKSAFGTVYLSRIGVPGHQIIYKYQEIPENDEYANLILQNEIDNTHIINAILENDPAAPYPCTYRIERCYIPRGGIKYLSFFDCPGDHTPNTLVLIQQGLEHVGSLEHVLNLEFEPDLVTEALTTLDFTHQVARITHLDSHYQNLLVVDCQRTDFTCSPQNGLKYQTETGARSLALGRWKVYLIDFGQSCSVNTTSNTCLSFDLEPTTGIIKPTTLTRSVAPAIDFITLMRGVWSIYFGRPAIGMMCEWFMLYVALTSRNILGLATQIMYQQPRRIYDFNRDITDHESGSDLAQVEDYTQVAMMDVDNLAKWIIDPQRRSRLQYHLCRLANVLLNCRICSNSRALMLLAGWLRHRDQLYRSIHQYRLQPPTLEVLELFQWRDETVVYQRMERIVQIEQQGSVMGWNSFYISDYLWLLEQLAE